MACRVGASGGGFSAAFSRPAWQTSVVGETGRGVPDVCANADPETGYNILVDGRQEVIGGTSAVAPLWAGLIALLNQKLQTRVGYINSPLYAVSESNCFHDITVGNNGAYTCQQGWDPVTGLGSPIGTQFATNSVQDDDTRATDCGGRRSVQEQPRQALGS